MDGAVLLGEQLPLNGSGHFKGKITDNFRRE